MSFRYSISVDLVLGSHLRTAQRALHTKLRSVGLDALLFSLRDILSQGCAAAVASQGVCSSLSKVEGVMHSELDPRCIACVSGISALGLQPNERLLVCAFNGYSMANRKTSAFMRTPTLSIPLYVYEVSDMSLLSVGCLCCSGLPRCLVEGLAARDVAVRLDNNPWEEPPTDVVKMGMSFTANYLKDLDDYGRISSNRLKVVLVGLASAGKTSLAIRLDGGNPDRLPIPEERTIGVEIRDMTLGRSPANQGSGASPELDLKVWDFVGQRAYYDTHQVEITMLPVFYGW